VRWRRTREATPLYRHTAKEADATSVIVEKNREWLHYATIATRDCNPGLEFSIPGFGIVEFPIPGSRDPVGIGVV